MKAHEIFRDADPSFANDIVRYFREEQREIYKATIATLAQQRKLRPVFIFKKPATEQMAWLLKILQNKVGDGIGEHLLQVWLLKKHTAMLTMFLDELGIEHKDGEVEDLPETLDPEKVKSGVDKLLADFAAPEVFIYLHLFQRQTSTGFPEIAEVLANDSRLKLRAE